MSNVERAALGAAVLVTGVAVFQVALALGFLGVTCHTADRQPQTTGFFPVGIVQ